MALRSYEEYATRLNWHAFGERCLEIIGDARESS
jgi:hypothetical protein